MDTSSRLRVPALTRAKDAITNSIENLKNRPSGRGSRFHKTKTVDKQPNDDQVSQSLNARPISPLFSKKTNLDTLMAPIPTTPIKQRSKDEVRRERSWSGYAHSPHSSLDIQASSIRDLPQGNKGVESEANSRLVQSEEHALTKESTTKAKDDAPKKKRTSFDLTDKSVEVEFKAPTTPIRKMKSQRPRDLREERQSKTPPAPMSATSTKKKVPENP